MTGLFHSNQLSIRGTEVALYDYAHYSETLLGHRSVIVVPKMAINDPTVVKKFSERFSVHTYGNPEELHRIAKAERADFFYAIKDGKNDGILVPGIRNCIHAVFKKNDPHGDVYAYISAWLSNVMSQGRAPFVPHMVHLPKLDQHLRGELSIPADAVVFGRYGGNDTFNISYAQKVVAKVADSRKDRFFIFMNTDNFLDRPRKNVLFLPSSSDPMDKVRFINTCDAMLHARSQGESFGLACGEFSIRNKPVITCSHRSIRDRSHLEMLGKKGIYYRGPMGLQFVLSTFRPDPSKNWDAYSDMYSPEQVMRKFDEVFLHDFKQVR